MQKASKGQPYDLRHRQRINCGHNKRESLLYGIALFEGLRFITAEWEAGLCGAFCEAVNVAVTILGLSGILALAVMAAGGGFAIERTLYYIAKPIAFISAYFAHYALKDENSHISYKTHAVMGILSMRPPPCICQTPDGTDAAEGKASDGAAIAVKARIHKRRGSAQRLYASRRATQVQRKYARRSAQARNIFS